MKKGVNNMTAEKDLFTDPKPWSDPVKPDELLNEIIRFLEKHIVLPEGGDVATALWVFHAHCLDAFELSPILQIKSPMKRCGKSTLLGIVGGLLPRNISSGSASSASVFRLIDKFQVSICIDEADINVSGKNEFIELLNSSYLRKTARVLRCSGKDHDPRPFSSWGPKVVAGIGNLSDTTEDRSIQINMRRKTFGDRKVVRYSVLGCMEVLETLHSKLARFARNHIDELKNANPLIPEILGDRQADNWRSLLAIADLAGGEWPDKAREAALGLCGEGMGEEEIGEMLLWDLQKMLAERGDEPKVFTEDIIYYLVNREDRPWPEYKNDRPITPPQLAKTLRGFGIKPKDVKINGKTKRGYFVADFKDAFARYLPATGATDSEDEDPD
jgi:hypothetical protein